MVKNRFILGISFVCAAAAVVILFYLTFQSPEDTVSLSDRVSQMPRMSAFLSWAGMYVTWSVRQWAHVFEFLIIGALVYIFMSLKMERAGLAFLLSVVICVVISLCDQSVRIFIQGRHFDSFDLVLDALGYGTSHLFWGGCRLLFGKLKKCWSRKIS